jgi:pimeloyl-ACP methyl ester carboxylesterase
MIFRATLHLPVTLSNPLPCGVSPAIALDIFAPDPARLASPVRVMFCLPGGGMNRQYFNLVLDDDKSYSFGEFMAAQGDIVVAIDPLGVGESTRPLDGFALEPELLAEANVSVIEQVLSGLRCGTLIEGWPKLPELVSIGVAHSVGSVMTILQQVIYRCFDGIALSGFSCNGLPPALKPAEQQYAGRAKEARAVLAELARARYETSYPEPAGTQQGRDLFTRARADRKGVEALAPARDRMLVLAATLSIIPGNIAPECAEVDVPVFLALGDLDFCGPPHEIPASFPKSPDITLVILPETGHTHFIFPSRVKLFGRLCDWARTAVTARPAQSVREVAEPARLGVS